MELMRGFNKMKASSRWRQRQPGMGGAAMILIALVAIIVVGGLWLMGGYNNLVAKDSEVERRAANMQSQLKRRADLVPNLVATVKGYAKHERGVYADIAQARSRLLSANVGTNPQEAAA